MSSMHAVPLLLSVLVGLLLCLVAWGLWQVHGHGGGDAALGTHGGGDVLLWFLVLAAFALGVFLTYVLISVNF